MTASVMKSNSGTSADALFAERVEELTAKFQAGEPFDVEEYLARYPELADRIRPLLPALQMLGALSEAGADGLSFPLAQQDQAADTGTLGDFRIIREVGRGGMGVVYEAEQISLGRRVALKVLPFAATMDPRQLQRFHNEARAAASLHHEHIVAVHAVGCERAVHFYAMQFIEGKSFAELIAAQTQPTASGGRQPPDSAPNQGADAPRSPSADTRLAAASPTAAAPRDEAYFRRVAEWGIQAAEALEYAHALGIVHRDVKPANLLVDVQGKLWVTDFGLARTVTDAGLTMSGDLLGTLRYMSPEQALAKHGLVDHRTDVYSLGATLYELVTGRPAVEGPDRQEILRRIADEDPSPIGRGVPADLETIVLKAMAREPAERYATARELADDLRRFLGDRPVKARRPSLLQRLRKWCRRHQRVVTAIAMTLTGSLAVSTVFIWREQRETLSALHEVEVQRGRAEARELRARQQLYAAHMRLAHEHALHGEAERLNALLDDFRPAAGEEDLRGFEWYYLRGLAAALPRERLCFLEHQCQVMCAVFTPDGRAVASGDENGAILLWDAATGARRLKLKNQDVDVDGLAFSPGDGTLASAGEDQKVRLWDLATGRQKAELFVGCGDLEGISFSPDGRQLVVPGADGHLVLLDVSGGALRSRALVTAHSDRVYRAVFSPDGRRIASVSKDGHLKTWDALDGRLVSDTHHGPMLFGVAYSPDGARLVTADSEHAIQLWEAGSGRALGVLGSHTNPGRAVAFAPDGRRVVSGGDDGVLRIWYPADGLHLARAEAHRATMTAVSFSPDGQAVVTAGRDNAVRVWDVPAPPWHAAGSGHGPGTRTVFSPDGRYLAVWAAETELGLWTVAPPKKVAALPLARGTGDHVVFAPDGQALAVSAQDGHLAIYRLEAGGGSVRLHQVFAHVLSQGEGEALAFDHDGRLVVSRNEKIWFSWPIDGDVPPAEQIGWRMSNACRVVPGPDGCTLAVGGGRLVRFWDTVSRMWRPGKCQLPATLRCLAYAPDGRLMAVGTADGRIVLLDPAAQEIRASLYAGQREVTSLAWCPDGRTLVSASLDGKVRLWHTATGQELFTLEDRAGRAVHSVAFSRDGRTLLTAGDPVPEGRNVTLWYAAPDGPM